MVAVANDKEHGVTRLLKKRFVGGEPAASVDVGLAAAVWAGRCDDAKRHGQPATQVFAVHATDVQLPLAVARSANPALKTERVD